MSTLILDQFTDSDSTNLSAHTIAPTNTPATAWTIDAATFEILSNQAHSTSSVTTGYARCDAGNADVSVSCDITAAADASVKYVWDVLGRYQDINNHWMLELYSGDNTIRIYQRSAGTYTSRASASFTPSAAGTYNLKLTFNGTSITGYIDGVSYVSFTSSTLQTQTKHGLRANQTVAGNKFDNFLIETIAAGSAPVGKVVMVNQSVTNAATY